MGEKTIWDECVSKCPWRVKSYSSAIVDEDGNMAHVCKASGMKCESVNCAPSMMFGFQFKGAVGGCRDGNL